MLCVCYVACLYSSNRMIDDTERPPSDVQAPREVTFCGVGPELKNNAVCQRLLPWPPLSRSSITQPIADERDLRLAINLSRGSSSRCYDRIGSVPWQLDFETVSFNGNIRLYH